ncbi:hypothetical protein J2S43_008112 [Catenuloplanes nepalensis]|uniref:Plasmid pRiA4b Orf3-like domain-containing protein n=1 Tax=Catenuloplanes nepalensis TaxID=587533 RepID=A0ABT9N7C1_9ACTN|nr:plasmid pRiA4b ORF-3 family protein [Catenuloplanes nepalensis]MDP9799600.1 hypothetical protein [Catenuloplanes nepalensis]
MAEAPFPTASGPHGDGTDDPAELRRSLVEAGMPPQILELIDGTAADREQVIAQLNDAGLLPGPDDAVANLVAGFAPLAERGADALSAEVSGHEFLAAMRVAAGSNGADDAGLADILSGLSGQVVEHGGPVALAMLRALAVTAPEPVRPTLAAAADRLAATGIKDRPWVKDLGALKVVDAFGHGDETGFQEAVAVTFRYGRREHTLVVLIDHSLGGGIKDCWVSPDPATMRDAYRQAAMLPGVVFRDFTPAEAATILRRALEQPPCPEQDDQIEDVALHLDLVRNRVARIRRPSTPPAPARVPAPAARGVRGTVHRLKVTLRGTKPPIWRRIEVPSTIRLDRLHLVLQVAFGWEDYHMWVFEGRNAEYGVPDPELGHRSAAAKKLADVAPHRGDRLAYTYDFGDDWRHDLLVEEVLASPAGSTTARCVTGRRAGPPEDCGGVWGYEYMSEILGDPAHEEHAAYLAQLGLETAADFDPASFDLDGINRELAKIPITR